MKLTLNQIKAHQPCKSGWKTLLKSLEKTEADNAELDLMYILKSNGIKDAIWCLRCFAYEDYCLFLADVAESVLHLYEAKYSSSAPRLAVRAIRKFHRREITKAQLDKVAADAADAAADAAYAAYAANAANAAANAAAADANAYAATATATATAAATAAATATATAAYADAATAARQAKWGDIEKLFIKHFS